MTFQIHALPPDPFAPLFALADDDLARHCARRLTVTDHAGTPCRVSLEDATPGETVLLLHYVHLASETPFRASHAIYVREGVAQARPAPGEVPEMLTRRLLSLRVFDAGSMMIDAEVVDGKDAGAMLDRAFADPRTDFVHLHFARQGCFAARVTRAVTKP